MQKTGPLTGVKVIEMCHVMAGPTCGRMLADMGADVIKLERVPDGDDTRRMLPPDIDGEPAAFMMMNCNKRGIAVDLKNPRGKEVLKKMLSSADVVTENYRADTMAKLGLGYDDLKDINPALVYCAISGFGRTGPYASRGGYDLIAQGMSGLMSFTGEGPGRPPVKVGAPVCDITAGIIAAMGVLAAYVHRLKTGQGQFVDTSLYEAGITHSYWQSAIALATGIAPGPMGSAHPLNGPYQAVETADGWITFSGANTRNWLRLLDLLGLSDLAEDPRFKENAGRMENLEELSELLSAEFRKKPREQWLAELEEAKIPAGPVFDVNEMHADPHTLARDMVVEVEHDRIGAVKTIGCPVKFSETPSAVHGPAPLYAQHTREVLAEFGYGADEIDSLVADGAVIAHEVE
ncbi:MAG: CoA transferase [Rhodospirillaceae bacterium]|jgi:crotonobetainyl-CoA:carnitine CoA-transferase CaiB-like acyl-CoA transferase|nr:CoA transferase [Rhodospirillaceae bacterium]